VEESRSKKQEARSKKLDLAELSIEVVFAFGVALLDSYF
jgi:hypothetical protein